MSVAITKLEIGHVAFDGRQDVWYRCPASNGAVTVRFRLKNTSEKTIKYFRIGFSAVNRVGDVVLSRYETEPVLYGKVTGPIAPRKSEFVVFKDMFWEPTISTVRIEDIEIQYMDDSIKRISPSELQDETPKPEAERLGTDTSLSGKILPVIGVLVLLGAVVSIAGEFLQSIFR